MPNSTQDPKRPPQRLIPGDLYDPRYPIHGAVARFFEAMTPARCPLVFKEVEALMGADALALMDARMNTTQKASPPPAPIVTGPVTFDAVPWLCNPDVDAWAARYGLSDGPFRSIIRESMTGWFRGTLGRGTWHVADRFGPQPTPLPHPAAVAAVDAPESSAPATGKGPRFTRTSPEADGWFIEAAQRPPRGLPRLDPLRDTTTEYGARAKQHARDVLTQAEANGLKRLRARRGSADDSDDRHFVWLVRYQMNRESYATIAKGLPVASREAPHNTVRDAVVRLAPIVGVTLRAPVRTGRPRKVTGLG
ncbi:MAG: hypothetical protein NT151_09540 [Acidobacteria bacterium]|nr:hypothetical protein [Acidobacteriota bacterium]